MWVEIIETVETLICWEIESLTIWVDQWSNEKKLGGGVDIRTLITRSTSILTVDPRCLGKWTGVHLTTNIVDYILFFITTQRYTPFLRNWDNFEK